MKTLIRFAFLATVIAGCSPGPGDNLVGTWTTQSGVASVQCFDQPSFAQTFAAGDFSISFSHQDSTLEIGSSAWAGCTFLANPTGPSTAEVIRGQEKCTGTDKTVYELTSGTFKIDGSDKLAASLQLTTTTSTPAAQAFCGRDQSLTLVK